MLHRALSLSFALTLATFAGPASAQCVGPDNLNGPCWAFTQANLPQFPGFQIPGLGVCWDQCTPNMQANIRLVWSTPQPTGCAQFVSQVDVIDSSSGATLMVGKASLDYTRTWEEVDTNNSTFQVWRFVVKADFGPGPNPGPVAPACPVPNCLFPLGPHQTSFFYGYVDYALRCGSPNPNFVQSLVLHHGCDRMIHTPGLSSRPGAFHPGRTFAMVAPHTSAMPFIPMNLPAPGGLLSGEAIRNIAPPAIAGCISEDKVSGGSLNPFINACLCTLSLVPPQYTLSTFGGKGSCVDPVGSVASWKSENLFPNLPWPHFVTASIGCWGSDAQYPGKECAFVNEGLLSFRDTCPASAGDYFEVFYGATTTLGWKVLTPAGVPALSQNFVDLADNFTHKIGSPVMLPLFGDFMPTNHLIYVNIP